ncbi:hypothetical protein [Granulicella sp. L46]|jgi:hypothetical protein|uniref:hypothetical protein n=1 Tax=Granulicella sp. L46 TaxID=1641865 RepID=UPI00131D7F76|nr:hypothetical protein [Granulicella sp. L46]
MNRRSLFRLGALFGAGRFITFAAPAWAMTPHDTDAAQPIVLYCDLAVDPARESEMLAGFHDKFKPAAKQFDGYVDLKMLKLRSVIQGRPAPPNGINYRFQLTYESEKKRQLWIHSDTHQKVWPLIEDTVTNKDYLVLLTEAC